MRQAVRAVGDDPLQRLLAATAVTFGSRARAGRTSMVWLACWGVGAVEPGDAGLHHKLWRRYRAWIERMIEQAAARARIELDVKAQRAHCMRRWSMASGSAG